MPRLFPYQADALANAEQAHALDRARALWGECAWVRVRTENGSRLYEVSSSDSYHPFTQGKGESWDEAFQNAGVSLFQ